MSLVVAAADDAQSAMLQERLNQLGLPVLPAHDPEVLLSVCEHALPDAVVVSSLEQACLLAREHPRLPVVLLCAGRLDAELVLEALRLGVADVWSMPMASDDLAARLAAIGERRAARASDAERRLGRLVADLELDQRAGRYIQLGMLPPNPMAIDGFRLQHDVQPSLILSGDFVDYFRITDSHFAFYVADVSGHGASSAFVTVLLKNFSRRLRREFRPGMLTQPGEILQWINRELLEQRMDKHVALILGVGELATGEIRLVNGGHYPPAILAGHAGAELLEQRGKPVGLFAEVAYDTRTVHLEPGERLVMFSDGVMDVMGALELPEKERKLLQAATDGHSVEEIWQRLGMDMNVGKRPDDMACLVVQRES